MSCPLAPSCAFLLFPVVGSDTVVRLVGGWIDLLFVHMAVKMDVHK